MVLPLMALGPTSAFLGMDGARRRVLNDGAFIQPHSLDAQLAPRGLDTTGLTSPVVIWCEAFAQPDVHISILDITPAGSAG